MLLIAGGDPSILFQIIHLGCVDDLNGYDGYNCSEYEKYCSDSYKPDYREDYYILDNWYRKFRAACKNTCSRYASSYCIAVTCKG